MSENNWKKRYTFRLTDEDKAIHDFIEKSKETNSETIRRLLKFALMQIELEKKKQVENKLFAKVLDEIQSLKEQQEKNHLDVMERINSGVEIKQDNEKKSVEQNKVDKSIENSMNSMLESFGM